MDEVIDSVMKLVVDSPNIALWVLVIIYGFKVVIVGSIYGTIRFVVAKLHDGWVRPRIVTTAYKFPRRASLINEDAKLHMDELIDAITTQGHYIHACDIRRVLVILQENKFKPA